MLIIFYMVLVQRVRFRMAVIGMALIVLTQITSHEQPVDLPGPCPARQDPDHQKG
jgi:hypothetical protein